jgi:hypothetical protein
MSKASSLCIGLTGQNGAYRKYQRTQVMITSSENHLFANNGFRPDSCFRILPFSVTKTKVQQSPAVSAADIQYPSLNGKRRQNLAEISLTSTHASKK